MKVGILGGGQLAKMLSEAASDIDVDTLCVDSQAEACAKDVTTLMQADLNNPSAIEQHFKSVDCVTFETENLPFATVAALAAKFKLSPSTEALRVTQDRLLEKDFLTSLTIPVASYIEVASESDLQTAATTLGYPYILKTRRHGYDGKGQAFIDNDDAAKSAWQEIASTELIAEKVIRFDMELSLISVRGSSGVIRFYPLILNQHEKGILRISCAPYRDDELTAQAQAIATTIMEQFDYVGVMTVEFFCVDGKLLVNEIAPRVHNSGHWTIEGAKTSQFENHMRAICDLPLGPTDATSYSAMVNIIGSAPLNQEELEGLSGVYYHWYGKEPRAGRKLGHVTICANSKNALVDMLAGVVA